MRVGEFPRCEDFTQTRVVSSFLKLTCTASVQNRSDPCFQVFEKEDPRFAT